MGLHWHPATPPDARAYVAALIAREPWVEHALLCGACSRHFADTDVTFAEHKQTCKDLHVAAVRALCLFITRTP